MNNSMEQYTNAKALQFVTGANHVLKFRTLMFFQIPLIWFSGIRVKHFNRNHCEVKLPFTRRTQNPFRSVYFAAQCMAAELSTGLMVMAETLETGKKCSMLVTHMNAVFVKKASEEIIFSCEPLHILNEAIQLALKNNEPVKFKLKSEGKLKDGTVVAEFEFEWSLKFKS
jgi:acyl-coenzyme A thioesterase PaaI-like protein